MRRRASRGASQRSSVSRAATTTAVARAESAFAAVECRRARRRRRGSGIRGRGDRSVRRQPRPRRGTPGARARRRRIPGLGASHHTRVRAALAARRGSKPPGGVAGVPGARPRDRARARPVRARGQALLPPLGPRVPPRPLRGRARGYLLAGPRARPPPRVDAPQRDGQRLAEPTRAAQHARPLGRGARRRTAADPGGARSHRAGHAEPPRRHQCRRSTSTAAIRAEARRIARRSIAPLGVGRGSAGPLVVPRRSAVLLAEGRFAEARRLGLEADRVARGGFSTSQQSKQGLVVALEATLALGEREPAEILAQIAALQPGLRPPYLEAHALRFEAG